MSDQPPPYPGAGAGPPFSAGNAPDPGAWQMPPPPYSEADPVGGAGSAPREVMIVTGGWDGNRALSTVEQFDPVAGEWSFLPQLPSPRRDHGAGWVGGRLVVVGGWNMDPYYDTCEVFCPRSQAWSPGPSLSGPRGWPGVAALQDTLYCVGGYDARERALTTVERLPPGATSWEPVAGLNKARGGCGLVAHSGKLYAIGGYDGKKAMKSVEMFDPAVGRWVKVEELPERREDLSHSCAVYNNTIVVAGGVDDDERVLASCVQYSPDSDRWSRLQANMLRGKRGVSLATLGGVMFAAGGEDQEDAGLELVMMHDSKAGRWVPWHPMRGPRAGHAVSTYMKEPFTVGGGGFAFQL